MDALRQLEENEAGAPMYGPRPQPAPPKWKLEDFSKHQPAKFDGKASLDDEGLFCSFLRLLNMV